VGTPITFRPLVAGVINVVVVAEAVLPGPLPPEADLPPRLWPLTVRLDVFAPGATTPTFSQSKTVQVGDQTPDSANRAIVFGDIMASANQIAGDWTVKVSNDGELAETFDVTVRYAVTGGNLGKIDHIFVVMMENRSFDHMLGYLKLAGRTDVDGLTQDMFNNDDDNAACKVEKLATTQFKTDPGHGWTDVAGTMPGSPASTVPYQLQADGANASNGGFVKNFKHQIDSSNASPPHDYATVQPGATRTIEFLPGKMTPGQSKITIGARSVPVAVPPESHSGNLGQLSLAIPGEAAIVEVAPIGSGAISLQHDVVPGDLAGTGNWSCQLTNLADVPLDFVTDVSNCYGIASEEEPAANIMGYYDASGVPVYDKLASQFTICDRWFASIPTDTFPNRLYAMSGSSDGMLTTPTDASVASNPPAYTTTTIFENLQQHGVDWNVFFSDLPFALVFKTLAQDAQYTARMKPMSSFFDRAKTGELPAMAWIDPNFNDVPDGTDNASDDHPPGDVARGQRFIGQVYNALANSPAWSRSLLVITYDEHGGFFDHVVPPGTPVGNAIGPNTHGPKDDDPNLQRYGLRVPAIIVSPWVPQGTCSHTVYDHTSILRSILLRFCGTPTGVLHEAMHAEVANSGITDAAVAGGAIAAGITHVTYPSMGARTDSANSLEHELSLDAPRPAVPIAAAMERLQPNLGTQSPLEGIGATLRLGVLGF
jgi:phospholipase C